MSNVHFWNEVMNKLDSRLTDEAASNLYFYQKSQDAEISEYISDSYNGITGKVRKRNGMIGFAACIAVIVCLAVAVGVILQNNVAVQPLDSNDEYSYLLETEKYTYKTNVYFLTRELGEEYLEHTDILDNQLILNSVETYILAADFKNEYYIFGDAEREEELTKYYFDDPIGGKDGMQKNGWLINFSPDLLEFICEDNRLKDFCNSRFDREGIDRKIEEITDVYIVCIPGMAALVHFEDGGQTCFLHHAQNTSYDDNVPFDIFSREELVDYYALKERPVTINQNETLNGIVVGNMAGATEVNVTKLLEHIVDEEFIVREGNITTVYMKDMITGEKRRVCVFDSKTGEIEVAFQENDSTPKDFWNSGDRRSWFEQNDLYMNGPAAYAVMAGFEISVVYVNDIEGQSMFLSYDESSNCFTKSTDYLSAKDFGLTIPRDTVTLYSKDGKVIVPFSVRVPYAEIYTGMPIEFELKIEDNGKPVPINGKESYKFTTEIDPDTRNYIVDGISLDCEDITFNEYGYAENLTAYMTYTVDGRETASDKIETRTDKRGFLVRNNPDGLTEEELAATNPIITKCEKRSDGAWNMTIDLNPIADENENIASFVQFIDEKNNTVVKMSNNLKENTIGTTFMFVKGEELKIDVVLFNENDEPYLTLYMLFGDDDISFHYREKFLLTD